MMGGTATVVIEARSLMREALVSLIESHSYNVICSVASPADIQRGTLEEQQPKLIILGALPADHTADTTRGIRRCWQDAKIIVLFDHASPTDLQHLLASDVDACISMDASPRTLIDTLRLIVCESLRVLVMAPMERPRDLAEQTIEKGQALEADLASCLEDPSSIALPCAVGLQGKGEGADEDYRSYGLSKREEVILKALARGYSNKMIGRIHFITEATVKLHVKGILRKIRVANRTQAAVWALRTACFSQEREDEGSRTEIQEMRSVNGHSS